MNISFKVSNLNTFFTEEEQEKISKISGENIAKFMENLTELFKEDKTATKIQLAYQTIYQSMIINFFKNHIIFDDKSIKKRLEIRNHLYDMVDHIIKCIFNEG